MPSEWTPQSGTDYFHWSYTDGLGILQRTGFVWGGKIPSSDPAFDSHMYGREGDFDFYVSSPSGPDAAVFSPQPTPSIPLTFHPIANHNLIASEDAGNQSALEDIYREIRK